MPTILAFEKLVQGRIPVGYARCTNCGSLQTDAPTWLEAAYRDYPGYGVDAAQRGIYGQARVLFTAAVFGMTNATRVLDYGGGSGLLTRLLRDAGFDAHVFDPFAPNMFAPSFDGKPDGDWDIVCAFEVLEHLPQPRADLALIFASRPRLVIASTWPYHDEGKDWPYLHQESGQHVFFWGERGLALAGEMFGYEAWVHKNNVVFSRSPITRVQRALMATHDVSVRLTCAGIPLAFRGNRYAIQDEYQLRGIVPARPRPRRKPKS